jgi:hypothetical protein
MILLPGHFGICGNEIDHQLAKDDSVHQFLDHSWPWGYSSRIEREIKQWLVNQHTILWQGLTSMSKA